MPLTLTRDQIRRVDQLAVERYGIPSIILMENAGRGAAEIIDGYYGPNGNAVIFCGTGNNGGDGCVIARRLHNLGWSVSIIVTGDESRVTPDMGTNLNIVRAMGLDIMSFAPNDEHQSALSRIKTESVVIDALLGTGFRGQVREPLAGLIRSINESPKRATVAVDVPSGLDCETGSPSIPTIHADHTITFVAHKSGFSRAEARPFLGQVDVSGIGAPRALIDEVARTQNHGGTTSNL